MQGGFDSHGRPNVTRFAEIVMSAELASRETPRNPPFKAGFRNVAPVADPHYP